MKKFLIQLLRVRLSPERWTWFEALCHAIEQGTTSETITAGYASFSRRLGKHALQLDASEQASLPEQYRLMKLGQWGIDEAGRAVILLCVADRRGRAYAETVQRCYDFGDSREQQSWLRSLSLLPDAQLFLPTAIDACRTNIIPLFEAIACENPYPSQYFPELNFNQMVLKCLFNRIALARIIGLESRYNPELSRMADHYARELTAAGRQLPSDIGILK